MIDVREARPRLSVVGTGYLGATHAACMADLGFDVVGVDTDRSKVDRLAAGEVPFFEPGLAELLRKNLDTGRLRFSTSYDDVADADVHFVCVGTPQVSDGNAADLAYVDAAFDALLPQLRPDAVVVGKSTVPVGTAERLLERLQREVPADLGVELVWNPEFLREGWAIEDTLHPDRLVLGVTSARGEQMLRTVYAPLIDPAGRDGGVPVVVTDLATAQLVKV